MFKTCVLVLAVGLMALYLVFLATKMARTPGANQNLVTLAVALGVGAVVGAVAAWLSNRAHR
jgi:multisubunit Na+/H+ antiporter MnhB subunit